ncbi:hypothetical protein EDB85DRAFT_1993182 [Lactarius pseudohatsudake]|nr:hypothetical protein EDB85DRAFT_1993182 [Lactarius pseudohatsudake]
MVLARAWAQALVGELVRAEYRTFSDGPAWRQGRDQREGGTFLRLEKVGWADEFVISMRRDVYDNFIVVILANVFASNPVGPFSNVVTAD